MKGNRTPKVPHAYYLRESSIINNFGILKDLVNECRDGSVSSATELIEYIQKHGYATAGAFSSHIYLIENAGD